MWGKTIPIWTFARRLRRALRCPSMFPMVELLIQPRSPGTILRGISKRIQPQSPGNILRRISKRISIGKGLWHGTPLDLRRLRALLVARLQSDNSPYRRYGQAERHRAGRSEQTPNRGHVGQDSPHMDIRQAPPAGTSLSFHVPYGGTLLFQPHSLRGLFSGDFL